MKAMIIKPLFAENNFTRSFLRKEDGLGTVEVVLILAVLVGISLIFRQYIFSFVRDIMENIMGGSISDIVSNPLR